MVELAAKVVAVVGISQAVALILAAFVSMLVLGTGENNSHFATIFPVVLLWTEVVEAAVGTIIGCAYLWENAWWLQLKFDGWKERRLIYKEELATKKAAELSDAMKEVDTFLAEGR